MAEKKGLVTSYMRMIDSIESRSEKILVFVNSFDPTKQEKDLLEDKLDSVDVMRSLLQDTEMKLYGVIKDEDFGTWQSTCEKIEDKFDEIRHLIRKKLREIDPPVQIISQPSISGTQQGYSKLPDIPLPRFNGLLEDWTCFKSQFTALICRREMLSESEKLFYLKAAIQNGTARHIQSSEDTFSSLWNALCSEFENKRLLVDKHISQLLHLKPIPRESGSLLRGLINEVTSSIRSLSNLHLKIDPLSEQMLVNIVCARLDARTRKDFEIQLTTNTLPNWSKLLDFLQTRCRCLESMEQDRKVLSVPDQITRKFHGSEKSNHHVSKSFVVKSSSSTFSRGNVTCFVCKGNHFLNRCEQFLAMSPVNRLVKIKSLGLCLNCFSNKHHVHECKSSSCRKCGRRHHTLLHEQDSNTSIQNEAYLQPSSSSSLQNQLDPIPSTSSTNAVVHTVATSIQQPKQFLLYTAVGLIEDDYGNSVQCRILLDCGSMHNIVTPHIVQALRLPRKNINMTISGVSGVSQLIQHKVRAKIRSIVQPSVSFNLHFLVMKNIATNIPVKPVKVNLRNLPAGIKLADPAFDQPQRIDMLLGIEVFNELFNGQSFTLSDDRKLWCKESLFGWVIGGSVMDDELNNTPSEFCGVITNDTLSKQISRFWEMENISEPRKLSPDERAAEQCFMDTYRRLPDGRYELGLPIKPSISELGDSQQMAIRRFVQLERRLIHNHELYEQYKHFMNDYLNQGHMIKIEPVSPDGYFIPHHAVLNPASTTTKTRVVFDASANTTAGTSLNDHLLVGPTVQRKLADIVLRFRVPQFVFTADITQMFRQIRVRQGDRKYQQIFWRSNLNDVLEVYQLATVTYGTACAPYLATRTLEQLCRDESEHFPLASKAGTEDIYVDDLLSGANTVEEALALQKEFIEMMAAGGFMLHKWASNHPSLLTMVSNADSEKIAFFKDEKTTRALGLTWQPGSDVFLTTLHDITFSSEPCTKRTVYSDIAKLYDPLGLLGPLIFSAKVCLQRLWQLEVQWDEVLTEDVAESWKTFRNQIVEMGEISINRCVLPYASSHEIELHGFCDASNLGYGACAYIRTIDSKNHFTVALLASKSRIAPLKNARPTIPRLELCGALVLAQLISSIKHNLPISFSRIILWSDSTTALSWITTDPGNLKTFVCNRVIEIRELTKEMEWRHVGTKDNPADLISRGLLPSEIRAATIWWSGPAFLHHDETQWPNRFQCIPADSLPEIKTTAVSLTVTATPATFVLFSRESKFRKMQRVAAQMLRFIDHIRPSGQKKHRYGPLTIRELKQATLALASIVQREAFPHDFHRLSYGQEIHRKSKLITFSVFLDQSQIPVIRVGGRICHASLPFRQKHPIILPSEHPFTEAVIRSYHEELLHAPQQMLLNALRHLYWVLHGRSTVRKIIRRCVTCFRAKPVPMQQIMGDLPRSRLQGFYPFQSTGVDFCGPMYIRQHNKRSTITYKAYVALFVCFATKAIHMELVGDLTADAFIAALQRFVARRGKCVKLFSDNGLNFVGSKNKLRELHELFQSQMLKSRLDTWCEKSAIEWHLIPPRSPHFGGLWEAGVRSAKYHLKRITGTANMNFEQYTTVLSRIEAILNSRPITSLSEDPNDANPLTPGHFLVGRPLTDIAEPDFTDRKESTLTRWQRQTKMVQHFWARWSQDYITTLQNRNKWHERFTVSPGQMVIVREDNVPTMQWKLGRIQNVIPGHDGLVRVADVRVGNKVIRRPVVKLCLLPIEDNYEQPDELSTDQLED